MASLGASLSLQGLSSAFSSGDLSGNWRECVLSAGFEGGQADQQTNGIQGMGLDSPPLALLYVGWGEKQTQTNDSPPQRSLCFSDSWNWQGPADSAPTGPEVQSRPPLHQCPGLNWGTGGSLSLLSGEEGQVGLAGRPLTGPAGSFPARPGWRDCW